MKKVNITTSRSGIFTVMKKELARFFGDRRMAFTTILLPGLMIYVMYSLMGGAFENMFTVDDIYPASAWWICPILWLRSARARESASPLRPT